MKGKSAKVRSLIRGTKQFGGEPGFYMCKKDGTAKGCANKIPTNTVLCESCKDIGLVFVQDSSDVSGWEKVEFNKLGFVSLGAGNRSSRAAGAGGPGIAILARTERGKEFLAMAKKVIGNAGGLVQDALVVNEDKVYGDVVKDALVVTRPNEEGHRRRFFDCMKELFPHEGQFHRIEDLKENIAWAAWLPGYEDKHAVKGQGRVRADQAAGVPRTQSETSAMKSKERSRQAKLLKRLEDAILGWIPRDCKGPPCEDDGHRGRDGTSELDGVGAGRLGMLDCSGKWGTCSVHARPNLC